MELHGAANLYHLSRSLPAGEFRLYKVAWIASCILYDRAKLLEVGGFSFWPRLPRYHSGEEVLVQNLLMRSWGGCASANFARALPRPRSEEHTSELQSHSDLVCRLL